MENTINNEIKPKKIVRRSSHTKHGPQPCQVCGKVFGNASALAKHKLAHSEIRRFVCHIETCAKAFKRQDHLNGHLLTHRHKKPFECKQENCGKSYCDARSLRRHIDNHHKANINVMDHSTAETIKLNLATVDDPESIKNHQITTLLSKIEKPEALQIGLKKDVFKPRTWNIQMQQNLVVPSDDIAKSKSPADGSCKQAVQCNLCNRFFKNIPALNGHMRLHGGYLKRDIGKFGKIKKEKLNTLTTVSVNVRALIEEKINSKKFELQNFQGQQQPKQIKFQPVLTNEGISQPGTLQLRHFLYPIITPQGSSTFAKPLCNVQIMNNNVLETRTIMITKQNSISENSFIVQEAIPEPIQATIIPKLEQTKVVYEEPINQTFLRKALFIPEVVERRYTPPRILESVSMSKRKFRVRKSIAFNGVQPKINVGYQHQAWVEERPAGVKSEKPEVGRETCLWSPRDVDEGRLELFLHAAKSAICCHASEEAALSLLNEDPQNPHKALLTLLKGRRPFAAVSSGVSLDWTEQEISAFVTAVVRDGKDFPKIAKHLERKSVKDCVQFYYACKRLNLYRELMRSPKN